MVATNISVIEGTGMVALYIGTYFTSIPQSKSTSKKAIFLCEIHYIVNSYFSERFNGYKLDHLTFFFL